MKDIDNNSKGELASVRIISPVVIALLILMSLICTCFAISRYRVFVMHEVFAASCSRQMILSGYFIVPYESGQLRLAKPPLAYWMIAISAKFTGVINESSTRIPSAISSLLLAALIGVWTAKWFGKDAGFLAAFVQSTCFYAILWGRKCEVDMFLTLINVSALYLIATIPKGATWNRCVLRSSLIFLLMGVSTLAKFHYGPALIIAITGTYWLLQNRMRDVIHTINPLGWVLWLAPFATWALMLAKQVPNVLETWRYETIGRATGQMNHDSLWYYIPVLLWLTIPWTPIWMMELKQSWRLAWKQKDPQERFLWIWFLVPFLIVTLQPDKHNNYLMTFLPPLSILAGRRLARELTAVRWLSFRWTKLQVSALTFFNLILGAMTAYVALRLWPSSERIAITLTMLVVVGFSVVAWLFFWNRQRAGVVVLAGCYTALVMIFFGDIQPLRDPWRIHAEFCERVAEQSEGTPILGYQLATVPQYYLGPSAWNYLASRATEQELLSILESHETVLIVSDDSKIEQLEKYGSLKPILSVTEDERRRWDGKFHLPQCWEFKLHRSSDIASDSVNTETQ